MNNSEVIAEGKKLFDTEIEALEITKNALDESFVKIVELIVSCTGKVVITGMGKPGHIGTKIAATMSSLGTPSFFLHPAEAQHGDLGMLRSDDVVIAISFSGESEEVTKLIPSLKVQLSPFGFYDIFSLLFWSVKFPWLQCDLIKNHTIFINEINVNFKSHEHRMDARIGEVGKYQHMVEIFFSHQALKTFKKSVCIYYFHKLI